MKSLWINLKGNWEDIKPLVTCSIESGVDVLVVEKVNVPKVKELARGVKVASDGGQADIKILKVNKKEDLKEIKKGCCALIELDSGEKEKLARAAAAIADWVVIDAKDWKIIPLENLIADRAASEGKKGKLLTLAASLEDIKLALAVLEKGVDGVVFAPKNSAEVKKAKEVLAGFSAEKIDLLPAKIRKIKPLGLGDRVCVDTIAMLKIGEGMLIGSQSDGFFLVHSETIENPYVETRPFRVNAGAVHAYIKVGKGKTNYLAELKSGDEVLIVHKSGRARSESVGRVKIERRPMLLIEAEINGRPVNAILQNAETIALVGKDGKPVSVSKLKIGDEVLAHTEQGGRHFGMKVEETLVEK